MRIAGSFTRKVLAAALCLSPFLSVMATERVSLAMDVELASGCDIPQAQTLPVILKAGKCPMVAAASWTQGYEVQIRLEEPFCGYSAGTKWTTTGQVRPYAEAILQAIGPLPVARNPDEVAQMKKIEDMISCIKHRSTIHVENGSSLKRKPK